MQEPLALGVASVSGIISARSVLANDLVHAPRITHGEGRAVQADFIQLVSQSPLGTATAYALQSLSESLSDGFGCRFAGQLHQSIDKVLDFLTSDV